MKKIAVLSSIVLLILFSSFSFPSRSKYVYAFGVATSFADSLVYFTNVQLLDSAKITDGLLKNRPAYTYQMKNYFDSLKIENRVCMIYYSSSKAVLEKKFKQISSRAIRKGGYFQIIDPKDFRFKKVHND